MPEPHLPDPDLIDNLIPVVGQEGSHVGQEGSCQETVTHQVAQVLLQALEDSRGGVSLSDPPALGDTWNALRALSSGHYLAQ